MNFHCVSILQRRQFLLYTLSHMTTSQHLWETCSIIPLLLICGLPQEQWYSTWLLLFVTVQLNLNLTFTRFSHQSYSKNLSNHLWVTREHTIQYYNLILDTGEWCTREVHYLRATYRTLHVNFMCGHLWIVLPLVLHDVHSIWTLPGYEL